MNANTSRAPGSTDPASGRLPATSVATAALGAAEVSFTRALQAEWLKLTSLRLNWWLGLAALGIILITLIATGFSTSQRLADSTSVGTSTAEIPPASGDAVSPGETSMVGTGAPPSGFSIFENVFSSFTLVTLLMGALAAVAITTEHTSGSIRSSLAAVPNRTMFFTAKLLAVCGFIGALTAALMVLSFVVLLPLTGFYDVMPPLLDPELWWMVFSNWAVVVITASLAFGLGALLRSTAGAVITYCLLLFSGPVALGLLIGLSDGAQWVTELMRFEIFALQRQFIGGSVSMATDLPVPLAGALLLGWAGVVLIPGWLLLTRRDV